MPKETYIFCLPEPGMDKFFLGPGQIEALTQELRDTGREVSIPRLNMLVVELTDEEVTKFGREYFVLKITPANAGRGLLPV